MSARTRSAGPVAAPAAAAGPRPRRGKVPQAPGAADAPPRAAAAGICAPNGNVQSPRLDAANVLGGMHARGSERRSSGRARARSELGAEYDAERLSSRQRAGRGSAAARAPMRGIAEEEEDELHQPDFGNQRMDDGSDEDLDDFPRAAPAAAGGSSPAGSVSSTAGQEDPPAVDNGRPTRGASERAKVRLEKQHHSLESVIYAPTPSLCSPAHSLLPCA